jgi:protein-S-isoprenylcysteine O-methyltransferase Ste14
MFRLIGFIVFSVVLAYLSRASLCMPRSHGFYRFFGAEFVLALILLNLDRWFVEPFSSYQMVSWLLLTISVVLVLNGAFLLKIEGRPSSSRTSEVPLAGLERTTELVTKGVYGYIRHPLYASAFYGAWGVFFKDPSWPGVVLALGSTGFWLAAARIEEAECIRYFGAPYREYIRRTKMFVPFLF